MRLLPVFLLLACPGPALDTKGDSGTDTLPPTSELTGRIWSVDLASAAATPVQLDGFSVRLNLVSVTEDAGPSVALRIAGGSTDGTQDFCVPTIDLPTVGVNDGRGFDTTATSVSTTFDGHLVTLLEFHLSGTFSADAAAIEDGTLSWYVRAAELSWLQGDKAPSDVVCDLLLNFGESCVACPDSSGECVYVTFTGVTGTAVDLAALVSVEEGCAE